MNPTIRQPAVAGSFYPSSAKELRATVERLLAPVPKEQRRPRLAYVPHAGYAYSGAIAAEAYGRVRLAPLVVVLAPNHHGIGAPLALPREGSWRTPLGDLALDADVACAIGDQLPDLRDDWRAHSRDHALEVQLPFLQVVAEQAGTTPPRLVTMACGTHEFGRLDAAGRALAAGLRSAGVTSPDDVLIVVSGDMSHYIPADEARALDLPILERLRRLEAAPYLADVLDKGISTCGSSPAVVGMVAARELGAGEGEVVRYGHSGEVTGDDSSVVAYASVLVPAD